MVSGEKTALEGNLKSEVKMLVHENQKEILRVLFEVKSSRLVREYCKAKAS